MPRILVSNDDGIDAPGIDALARAMAGVGTVTVAAPDRQQSAVGHALTVALPLRAVQHARNDGATAWAVSGTPADAVKLAVKTLMPEAPDLVVSGINHGRNAAISLIYSGTVSAATEGTLLGIPSIAFSLDSFALDADFTAAARVARWLAPLVLQRGLPRGVLLNVNIPAIPAEEIRGVRLAPQGHSYWDDTYDSRTDPMGRTYYWLTGRNVLLGPEDADEEMLTRGYITITPVHYRLTDDETLRALESWKLQSEGMPDAEARRVNGG